MPETTLEARIAFRLAPPAHEIDPSGQLLFMDMRHRSTPGDRATVRAGNPQGQTHAGPAWLCLWMTGCPRPRQPCYVPQHRGSPPPSIQRRISRSCDARHIGTNRPLTCENSTSTGSWTCLGPALSTTVDVGFTTCGQSCGHSDATSRQRPYRPKLRPGSSAGDQHQGSGSGGAAHLGPRRRLAGRGRRPPAQPAGLAQRQRAGDPAREHRHRRGAQRLHPQPARGPAARPARGRAQPPLRPRDPDRGHREPRARDRADAGSVEDDPESTK